MNAPNPDTIEVRGVELRRDPAREPCFTVVSLDSEMHEWPGMSAQARRERLHRHMNNEMGGLEIAAQCLADFPDAPWELRMELARQCWDETRHVRLLYRRLVELGGRKGEFPVSNFEWRVTGMLDSLAARLAVQNRTFEAGQMDIVGKVVDDWRAAGDERTAEMLEAILADDIQHVRFANSWLRRLAQDDPRVLMKIAAAIRLLATVTAALAPEPGEFNAVGTPIGDPRERVPMVNVDDRRLAAFTEDEIREILRQAGFRALLPPSESGPRS
jgi:hypothetical protein